MKTENNRTSRSGGSAPITSDIKDVSLTGKRKHIPGNAKNAVATAKKSGAKKSTGAKISAQVPCDYKLPTRLPGKVKLVSSKISYEGPLFNVHTDYVKEPEGVPSRRDVIRHSGSVVILAVDETENPADPIIILERQYRHAAEMYMWELPAGRKEPHERPLPAAKRELIEETGYRGGRWSKLVRYYASPGFLGEWMEIYLAQGVSAGTAMPEEDEFIQVERVPLSCLVELIHTGKISDGKTMIAVLLYQAGRLSGRF